MLGKGGSAGQSSAGHFFPSGKKGQEEMWKELIYILIILIVIGAIAYAIWKILPK